MTKLKYPVGTRFSNSEIYDAATAEVVHGWQVFEQFREDGSPTGRKSFVDNNGGLCGIEIAESKRKQAIHDAAPEMLAALTFYQKHYTGCEPSVSCFDRDCDEVLAKAAGILA